MKILVTGMAGFIGFHVAQILLARGDEVVGIDNLNDYYDVQLKKDRLMELGFNSDEIADKKAISNQQGNSTFIKLDLADTEGMNELFKTHRFDAVCHLAAQAGVRYSLENPMAYVDSNVVGFMNILENCRHQGVGNLCFASSSSVYGLNKSQPFKTSDHTDHPVSLYAATKKSNEMMAHTYAHLFGIKATGLRFFTVYGPWGRPDMAPMLFADAMSNNKPIKVFNHGKMSRDFTYIDDIAKGVVGIIDSPATANDSYDHTNPVPESSSAPYAIYNIGNNSPVPLMEFIETLENAFELTAEKNFMDIQPGDVESTYADSSALHNKLGFAPNTSLKKGIGEFAKWYQSYYR